MALYRVDALVLRTYKLGEADRIVVLLTRQRGKVRAVAKGVRRTKSKYGARLEPGSLAHLQLSEGRNLDIVRQAESIALHAKIREDVASLGRAAVLLEILDQVAIEGEPSPALYRLAAGALAELERSGNALVVPAFVARLLALEGVQPLLTECVTCGTTDDLVAIDLTAGGVTCGGCHCGIPISVEARTSLDHLGRGRVRQVLESTSEATAAELEEVVSRLIEQHLERRLKSPGVLSQQESGYG